jgi:hypothetical protein
MCFNPVLSPSPSDLGRHHWNINTSIKILFQDDVLWWIDKKGKNINAVYCLMCVVVSSKTKA